MLPLLEAVLLALVVEVRPRRPEVDDLGASVAVLLQETALPAVIRVGDPGLPADHAAPRVGPEVALVADADEGGRPDVAVADDALPVALLAEAADGDPRLLPAHDEVRVVARHRGRADRRIEKKPLRTFPFMCWQLDSDSSLSYCQL
jgi:hypothetical protein